MNNYPIGVFDSGIGGLSVVNEIKKLLPDESIVYLADNGNFPYGEKTGTKIKKIAEKNVKWLLEKKVKLIVVACNTATVNAISDLRKKFKGIEFVGMEPAVKPAGKISKKGIIILSAPKAADSTQLKTLVGKYTKNVKVYNLSAQELVKGVENQLNYSKIKNILEHIISKEQLKKSDVLVLGCTHFPLIRDKIRRFVGKKMMIIDSGEAVAKRVKFLLLENNLLRKGGETDYKYFTTGEKRNILGNNFDKIEL